MHAWWNKDNTPIVFAGLDGQAAPAMPWDGPQGEVGLVHEGRQASLPSVVADATGLEIRNGDFAVRVPATGLVEPPYPGPLLGQSFFSEMRQVARVETIIESLGPTCIQWRTDYHWGNAARLSWRARWAAGSDTIEVAESIDAPGEGALEWYPFPAEAPARAWVGGGGERPGPMSPLGGSVSTGPGRRLLAHLGHISYFNQWCQAWAGLTAPGGHHWGLFTGWGDCWQQRGQVRPRVIDDPSRGHLISMPLRKGRRCYGIVLGDWVPDAAEQCIFNRRRILHSDLCHARQWQLAATTTHPQLVPGPLPDELPLMPIAELLAWADKVWEQIATIGYTGIIIFHGRQAKARVYDFDAWMARDALSDEQRQRLTRTFLALAYIMADDAYSMGNDFWPHRDPDSGMREALADEMGNVPVPPNFHSEYFSTYGVVAELFPGHPEAPRWRAKAIAEADQFLATFFEPDGTYHESVNYHTHALSELLAWFHPLRLHGGRDFYQHPAIKGSFEHICQLQQPPLAAREGRAELPQIGNSGKHGEPQPFRGELLPAIDAYHQSDPLLAAHLMHLWQTGGRPTHDHEHPLLSHLCQQPAVQPETPPWVSVHRHALGIVSKARLPNGAPVYAFLRAGRATNHMDYDQGHLYLVAGDRVLLGDHGYHTRDTDGAPIHAASTWLHSTLTCNDNVRLSSGYTGLEQAPEPLRVHLGDAFDWCLHRIVNTNYRDLDHRPYNQLLPAPRSVHLRHYLFIKPRLIVLYDICPELDGPATCWFHPTAPVVQLDERRFRAGSADEIHLLISSLTPPQVLVNRPVGPLHALALRHTSNSFLTVLAVADEPTSLTVSGTPEALVIGLGNTTWQVALPPIGDAELLPRIT